MQQIFQPVNKFLHQNVNFSFTQFVTIIQLQNKSAQFVKISTVISVAYRETDKQHIVICGNYCTNS